MTKATAFPYLYAFKLNLLKKLNLTSKLKLKFVNLDSKSIQENIFQKMQGKKLHVMLQTCNPSPQKGDPGR